MRFNIARRHPFRIHGQNLFLDILADAGLMFFNQLRLEFSFSVSGNIYFYISETGSQRFLAVTIPAVIRLFVPIVILALSKFLIKFCIESGFHKFGNGFLEQILDILHAAHIACLQ